MQSWLLIVALTSLVLTGALGDGIINGKPAEKNSNKFMASVQINGTHRCGGFLIAGSYVLTAAHCDESGKMTVVLGTHDISSEEADANRYAVQKKHRHPSYKKPKTGKDIMILKLSKKVKTGPNVKIIDISSKDKMIKDNTKCTVAGWGRKTAKIQRNNEVNNLLETDVTIINNKTCRNQWGKLKVPVKLPDAILCAGGYKTKSGACQGDSGGPLVCGGLAVGVVSFNFNNNCDYPNVPNIYTQISKYAPWIKKVIQGKA